MKSKRNTGLTLFVQKGTHETLYLVASPKQDRLQVAAFGSLESENLLADITERLAAQKIRPRNLVLLLPRTEFDVNIFQVPFLDEDEIPSLINNLVAESHESEEITTDFLLNAKDTSDSQNALTWTFPDQKLRDFRADAKTSGMSLLAVTSHTMGSISLWRNLVQTKTPHAIILNIANRSLDFSVIYNREVTHVRSIPFASDSDEQIIPRLISELQRTVAITGGNNATDSTGIYLFGSAGKRKSIAEALTQEFEVAVSILNPLDNTEFKDTPISTDASESFVHLLGAAKGVFFDRLDVDLVSPRRAEVKQLPWRKIAWYSVAAAVLIGLGGFVLWDDANQQSEEIAEKRKQFDDLAKDARRVLEMKDELAAIRAWRKNEVVWLDEIDALSQRLPPREQSLIRRISMLSSNNGAAKIDLSVEVSDNELVAGLENAIRSKRNQVKSKRVSESSAKVEPKWNFETSIQFEIQPPKLSFVEQEEVQESNESTQAKGTPSASDAQSKKEGEPIQSSGEESTPKSTKQEVAQ